LVQQILGIITAMLDGSIFIVVGACWFFLFHFKTKQYYGIAIRTAAAAAAAAACELIYIQQLPGSYT